MYGLLFLMMGSLMEIGFGFVEFLTKTLYLID